VIINTNISGFLVANLNFIARNYNTQVVIFQARGVGFCDGLERATGHRWSVSYISISVMDSYIKE
jgi:hypothetical protein